MKNLTAVLLIIIYVIKAAVAQTDSLKRNSVYLELGGTGVQYAIGYERSLPIKTTCGINLAVGFSVLDFGWNTTYMLPIQLKMYHKFKKLTFEAGIGLTPHNYSYYDDINFERMSGGHKHQAGGILLFGIVGGKYSLFKDRFYTGIAFTPLLLDYHPPYFDTGCYDTMPWGAIQFGYKF